MANGWNNLTQEQRTMLGNMYGHVSDEVLANFANINFRVEITPSNLARRLRELRQNVTELGVDPSSIGLAEEPPDNLGVTTEQKTNELLITYSGETAHTLEELLNLAKVDLEVWEVQDYMVNLWEGFRSSKKSSLLFENGVIDGEIKDSGGVVVTPLHQVKVRLIRKKPIVLTPSISPIQITVSPIEQATPKKQSNFVLILPDIQVGFWRDVEGLKPLHDRAALGASIALACEIQPAKIILVGDLLDLAEWQQKFGSEPEMFRTTQAALIESTWWLSQLRIACPNSEIILLEGNHDQRIKTSMANLLPAAFGIRPVQLKNGQPQVRLEDPEIYSLRRLLDLDSLNIVYEEGYPGNSVWIGDTLEIIHGHTVKGKPGETTARILASSEHSVICGHIHRTEMATRVIHTRKGSRTITAASPGCLCRLDTVVPGHDRKNNWTQGLALVEPGETPNIFLLPIKNGSITFMGMSFTSSAGTINKELKKLGVI